jgi:uncharacterized protein YndB with AHSA1/START domain
MHPSLAATVACIALSAALPVRSAERSLDKEVIVPASIDAVWQAWTTTEGIKSFFAPDARIEARVGGPFEVYMDPKAEPGLRGADDMRVLAVQPKTMISFDWNAPPSLPQARQQRTFVVVRLQPVSDTSTRVTLHHTGWGDGGEWDLAYRYFDRAWTGVLGNLKTRFEKGPYDWAPWLAQLEAMRLQQAGRPAIVTK